MLKRTFLPATVSVSASHLKSVNVSFFLLNVLGLLLQRMPSVLLGCYLIPACVYVGLQGF